MSETRTVVMVSIVCIYSSLSAWVKCIPITSCTVCHKSHISHVYGITYHITAAFLPLIKAVGRTCVLF